MAGPAPPAVAIITDLRTPESVLFDPEQDVYFISNINGGMTSIDGDGFISRVDAATMSVNLSWVRGLDGPKGMAIAGNTLYVSDIRGVRKFDRRTGAALGVITLPGATFINDIVADGADIYVSDTGIAMGPGPSYIATGTDAIWRISNDRVEKFASGPDLQQPNGLDILEGTLRVASFSGNEIYELHDGKKRSVEPVPYGQLDGLIHLSDGTPVVSSWYGDAIYQRSNRGDYVPILAGIDAAADIGYDSKRSRLLVPIPALNQVTIHALR
jgi:hypothetical protein